MHVPYPMQRISQPPTVNFDCPNCGEPVREFIEDAPVYEPTADKASDMVGYGKMTVTCEECSTPFRVLLVASNFGLSADLEHHDAAVTVRDGEYFDFDYEEYARENLPEHPHEIFRNSMYDVEHLLYEYDDQQIKLKSFYRMLFTQYFSVIEAYLSDRLKRLIADDPAALVSLIQKNKEWATEKIPVIEFAKSPNAFQLWVDDKLHNLVYHRFDKVDLYYRGALGASIFPSEKVQEELSRFVPIRHDCVHRNGRDQHNSERIIGKDDLMLLASCIEAVVAHIETAFAERNKKPPA